MNWQTQLMTISLYVCKHYQNHLWVYSQRMSNYADLSFSDEEVITLYPFGVIDKNRDIKKIYEYADRYLRGWFTKLPSYTAHVQRLNKVADVEDVRATQNLTVLAPVKKQKGQHHLEPQEQWLSTALSRVRQPIETLFGWIEEKTGIECAAKVSFYNGLMVHLFGKLAAAMFYWNHFRVSS